ncbi:MAG: DUF4845 domain-containing protein [Steroidobacteraceae bacterium]|jgi:hypothetical protein|nr:DUF4845 domain-containing protein [Steroidobacteraceae bacterium]
MRHRQRGITFLGWVVLLLPVAIVVYIVIRAVPLYLNYGKVVQAIDQTQSEYASAESVHGGMLKASLQKRFDTGYIDNPKVEDVSIRKTGEGWVMEVEYEEVVPLFYNVSLLLEFEKSANVP